MKNHNLAINLLEQIGLHIMQKTWLRAGKPKVFSKGGNDLSSKKIALK